MTYGDAPLDDSPRPPGEQHITHSHHVADIINRCLQQDPQQRGSHSWLAKHPYTNNPTVL